ncbi:MAG: tRNA pseudouridine(38-40) synthase TruA [Candidatus Firestonebacteria bacterium]|nr:tRNA pseudouridine(38-40) synthase TruA [Candidatus Firestonebacteria bacterium]
MRNIKLTIEYDGTNYAGWQFQTNAISIQEIIENAIKKIIHLDIRLNSAGRTDAGVHAKGQTANFKANIQIPLWNLKQGINSCLPPDIYIANCEDAPLDFHSRFDAKKKHYRYIVCRSHSPFNLNYSYFYPFKFSIEHIKEASQYFLGKHNFKSFTPITSNDVQYIRSIDKINITEENEFVHLDFEAPSFLHNMIRIMVGTLLENARRNFHPAEIKNILLSKNRINAGRTAPARGLFLMKVYY